MKDTLVLHFSEKDFQVSRPFPISFSGFLVLILLFSSGLAGKTLAQSGNFELELNSASDIPDGCRLTFVASNNTGIALTKTAYEVAAFNAEGVVDTLMVLEFGELPLGKTRVVQFDLPAMQCAGLTRILVNDQDTCEAADGEHDICIKALSASSRIKSIPFGL